MTRAIAQPVAVETVHLTYRGDSPVIIAGPASGRLYHINRDVREVAADPRDVSALIATGRFNRIDE